MPDVFNLAFPLTGGGEFSYQLNVGNVLFVLGANGTGKSSLVARLTNSNFTYAKRISAHRQTWFDSNSSDITPSTRNQMDENIRAHDRQERSRHREEYSAQRPGIALFDLIDSNTVLNAKIAELARQGDGNGAVNEAKTPSPISVINELLHVSHIPIEIRVEALQKVVAVKNGGAPYSVAELSDGERNALLIAANVLTAPPGNLLLIDEPERHLHRSIISPLLTMLFQRRADCAFVVSTHEIMLPVDNPMSATILLRSCEYQESTARSWAVDLLPAEAPLDERLKFDILGGRKKMIFVEGTPQSLDAPLYSLLFPQVSIVPKSSCRDVENSVRGLSGAETEHWVKAWGIVDSDRRSGEEIAKLRSAGVFALPHYSVEALYYHPTMIKRVAARVNSLSGNDAESLFDAAIAAAIAETATKRDHFVLNAVERLTRRSVLGAMPSKADIETGDAIEITVDLAQLKAAEGAEFDELIKTGNLEEILVRYPLRQSNALHKVARALGFLNPSAYHNAVRKMVQEDADALAFLRSLFGELVAEVTLHEAPPS